MNNPSELIPPDQGTDIGTALWDDVSSYALLSSSPAKETSIIPSNESGLEGILKVDEYVSFTITGFS